MDGVNAELKSFVLMTYPVAKNVLNNYDLNVWRASKITSMDSFEHVRKSDKVHAGALCLADFKLCFIARRQNETTDELSIKSTGLGRIAVPNNLRQAEVF